MKRMRQVSLIFCISLFILSLSFCLTGLAKESQNSSTDLLNIILKQNSKYKDYNVETISDNFDSNGSKGYFFVFTEKNLENKYKFEYCTDIWYGSGGKVSKVVEEQFILPDTFGSVKLGGKTYFRYDLAYVTDSQTVLLSVSKGKCVESFRAPGAAIFGKGNSFTVICSAYDMITYKSDGFSVGHTWKKYYFYVDSKGFHEYTAKPITQKTFNTYANASAVIKNLNREFSKKDNKVTYKFLKRSNNLIHINIQVETEEAISYYYHTYEIQKDRKLLLVESGEGNYVNSITSRE